MTPLTRRILASTMVIALGGMAIAAVVWLVATTQGTRWLLTSLLPMSGISITAQKIEGRLVDHLLLKGVRVGLVQQKLEFDTLELRWKPLLLLTGTVAIQELVTNGVRIQDDTPPDNKPPKLAWPRVPDRAYLFDGAITHLQITDLSYRRLQEQPLLVTAMAASVSWQDDRLSITNLIVASPSGQIHGSVSTGFKHPSLTADLALALTHPVAEMDRFSLLARQSSTRGPEPFTGNLTLVGSAGTRKLLELSGDLGMAHDAINLRRLRLTRPGQKGVLTADGSLAVTAKESLLSLQVKAAGLDLAPELNIPTDISGALTFAGTLDSYRGTFTMANKAQGWQATAVSATYQGTRGGMKLAPMTASIIDGALAGNLEMDWQSGFALKGAISGKNLNPARLDPTWKGIANFSATGDLAWSKTSPLTGSVSGTLLESQLHGQALTGDLQAKFADNNVVLSRMALQGKGFDLHASGELKKQIEMSARISDFSRLVPGAAGTLQGEGWVRWQDRQLSGAVTGTGSGLAYAGTRIAGADLAVRLDQGPGYPVHVTASLRDVLYDSYKLSAATIALDGTLPRHTLNATLRSGKAEARLGLNAGYTAGIWQGELTSLSGRDANGPWNLTAPAAFAVSSGTFTLSPLALTADATEHVEVSANLALKPLGGQVRAQWSGLNLARVNPWLKDMRLSGKTNGTVRVGFLPDNQLTVAGSAALNGTFSGQGRSITIQRSQLTFDGNEGGLRVGVDLATADGGTVKGSFASAAPFRLAMPERGELRADVAGIDLLLLKPWLPPDTALAGRLNGTVRIGFLPDKRLTVAGNAAVNGTFNGQGHSISIRRSQLTFDGNERGLRVGVDLTMADGGTVKGSFASAAPFRQAMPEKGELTADVAGIDLLLLKPWLPLDTVLTGHISGRAKGSLLPGQRFDLTGTAVLTGGTLHQQRPDGEMKLSFTSANASWDWRGDTLGGTLALTTAEYGQVRGTFQLPLAARFPLAINPKGALRASLTGQVQEKGIVTALFPGLVQESSGELDATLAISGTWEAPQIEGKLRLSKAGAYLPTAGIHLKDVQLAARLEKNLIRIDSFRALSGSGHIEGTALITLAGWRMIGYKGTLTGDNFQTVNFPELQMRSSPKLSFEGTPQKLTLRGELRLPELNIVGAQTRTAIVPSSDVIREGVVAPAAASSPLVLDARVRLVLGDKVFVKVAGIDAQLGGAMDLSMSSLDRITSAGEIKVVKGHYRTYGVNLEIVRGRLFFAGGAVNRPSLDFLALRTIGNVRAGVTVAGTLQKPVTKLYSEPAMPDVDILAYIILGHPLGSSGEQASLLTQAAGALLTSSQASVLQEQIKNYLGLSTLEIQGGVGATPGAMGYKPLQVTAPGAIPATQQPGVTETVLTVGKYLTPKLYISYGKSLFTGGNLVRLRYDIFKKLQIETQTGSDASGVDLYYKLEFK